MVGQERVDIGAYEMQNVWYVDRDDTIALDRDGRSWSTAFANLTDALDKARTSGAPGEIWVANGTYYPGLDSQRDLSFDLVEYVAVYGGFQGYSAGTAAETSRSQRDPMPDSNGTVCNCQASVGPSKNGKLSTIVL